MNMHFTAHSAQTETVGLAAKPWSRRAIGGAYSGYQPMPAGEYTLEIVESHYRPNANGTGMVLACKAQFLRGEYDGRPFYISYVLEHCARKKQNRGQHEFAALRRATGVLAPDDSEELHFKPFRVKIGVQPSKRTGEPVNCIVRYLFDPPLAA